MVLSDLRSTGLLAATLAIVGLGNGPCAMIPGGTLDGPLSTPPGSWEMLGDGRQCDLEVNPASPTSVYIDCYTFEGQLYIHSHRYARMRRWWGEAWVTAAERDPEVRLRALGELYEMRADPVTDAALRERVLVSRGFDPVPEGIVLFALHPRRAQTASDAR